MYSPKASSSAPAVIGKLGIIYTPRPDKKRRMKRLRQSLAEAFPASDYLRAESSEDVERIAAMMVANGYETILVVGGDIALSHAVNALMNAAELPLGRRPLLGVVPTGYFNDFARYWGLTNMEERLPTLLANGQTRSVDVGRCTIGGDAGQTFYFLNCVNLGLAAQIANLRHKTTRLFLYPTVSYFASALLLIFKRINFPLSFHLQGEEYSGNATTLCIGSALGYGQTPNAVPYNGLLDLSLVRKPALTQLFSGFHLLLTGRFLSHRGLSVWRTRRVDIDELKRVPVSVDGRYIGLQSTNLTVDLLPEALDFLILP